MQITPLPVQPGVTAAQTPQAVTNVLPAVQGQASPPIVARAVSPSPKSEGGQKTRSNRERAKGGDKGNADGSGGSRGGNVNLSV